MRQGSIDELRDVIRRLHSVDSRYVESVPVTEEFQGLGEFHKHVVWSGIVHIFDLVDHPAATRCYVWADRAARLGRRQRFFAVLHQEPMDSPIHAVRAAIVADYEAHGGQPS